MPKMAGVPPTPQKPIPPKVVVIKVTCKICGTEQDVALKKALLKKALKMLKGTGAFS